MPLIGALFIQISNTHHHIKAYVLQYNLNLMSLQKLKIFKKLKGSQSYSHNPIIDSLIRQKLSSEMAVVKDNFNAIVKEDDNRQKQAKSLEKSSLRKRRLSQSITGLSLEKVKGSLSFTPVSKELITFVMERQNNSPFFNEQQVASLNHARSNSEDFLVRIKNRDKLDYSQGQVGPEMIERVRRSLPGDVWMPSSAQVEQILTQREQQEQHEQPFRLSLAQKSQALLSPLKSSRVSSSVHLGPAAPEVVSYPTKRYHKNDYTSLDKWLTTSAQQLNANTKSGNLTAYFNQMYGTYMCALKELIRLTYVQSAEKGLLTEKIVWSLVRLFEELLTQQHKVINRDFRQYSKQIKELHDLYSGRMTKLEDRLKQTEQKLSLSELARKQISLTCLSYKRVNEEMRDEIGRFGAVHKAMEREKDYLSDRLQKLVIQFHKRQVIKLQRTSTHLVYFFLNSSDKPQTIAKISREETLTQHFKAEMRKAAQGRISQALNPLENDLTGYWEKKKDFLQIDRIIYEHIKGAVVESGTQADGTGPYGIEERGTQYPEGEEETFQQYLKRQMNEEKQAWESREQQLQKKTITLRQLYDDARQAISLLTQQNSDYREAGQRKEHQIDYWRKKVDQSQQKCGLLSKKVAAMTDEKNELLRQLERQEKEIKELGDRVTDGKKRYLFEIENNNLLVASKLQLERKATEQKGRFDDLDGRVRLLVPHFEAVMRQEEAHPLMGKLTAQLQEHLPDYVEKDAQVFLTH